MREIKFRGKRVDNGEWVYGDLIHYNEQFVINVYETEVGYYAYQVPIIPETVGQFTGLYDKNGTEIYEGDILYFDLYKTSINDRVVKFKKSMFIGELLRNSYAYPIDEIEVNEHIVIGNIHDNPELLKGETK